MTELTNLEECTSDDNNSAAYSVTLSMTPRDIIRNRPSTMVSTSSKRQSPPTVTAASIGVPRAFICMLWMLLHSGDVRAFTVYRNRQVGSRGTTMMMMPAAFTRFEKENRLMMLFGTNGDVEKEDEVGENTVVLADPASHQEDEVEDFDDEVYSKDVSQVNEGRSFMIYKRFQNIKEKARSVVKPVKEAVKLSLHPRPDAIAGILFDAAETSVEEVGKVIKNRSVVNQESFLTKIEEAMSPAEQIDAVEATALQMIAEAKAVTETAIIAAENNAKASIAKLKAASVSTILSIEVTANESIAAIADDALKAGIDISASSTSAALSIGQESSLASTNTGSQAKPRSIERVFTDKEIETLSLQDVDFTLTEMAPPFIDEDQCLVPGEAIVRVEKAPDNARRIFAGIDINASVDDVWKVLTDYPNLQKVVPNLVKNDVVEVFKADKNFKLESVLGDDNLNDDDKVKAISTHLKGAVLNQVGGAKVIGINFSARTKLEVREWPEGMPDLGHFEDEVWAGKTRESRAKEERGLPLKRYHFPRPFAVCRLPHKDISMQSVVKDSGDFRMYQGVWRMQPLPGCAPSGENAMRLTYAVELSPRAILPVGLIENRIAMDLCTNLKSIRDFVQKTS